MRLAVAVIICSAGCGRFSFDRAGDGGVAGDGRPIDAPGAIDGAADGAIDGAVDAALAPIALVQQATKQMSSTDTITIAFTSPTTPGHVLVMMASTDTKITSIASVTGGGSTDWSEIAAVAGAGGTCSSCLRGAMWYGKTTASGMSVVVTAAEVGLDDLAVSITEWSGIGALEGKRTSGPVTSNDNVITPSITPAQPSDLVLAMGAWDRATLASGPLNGFTALQPAIVPNNSILYAAYAIPGAPTATGWDLAMVPQSWITIIATFSH